MPTTTPAITTTTNRLAKATSNWKRLLTELSQIEFHGGFILELSGNKEPEIVLAEARGARRYLREISRQLALPSPPTVNVANRTG